MKHRSELKVGHKAEYELLTLLDRADAQLDLLLSQQQWTCEAHLAIPPDRLRLHIYSTSSEQKQRPMDYSFANMPPSYYTVHISATELDGQGEAIKPSKDGLLKKYFNFIMLDTPTGTVVWDRRYHGATSHLDTTDADSFAYDGKALDPKIFNLNELHISRTGSKDCLVALYLFPDLSVPTYTTSHALLSFLKSTGEQNNTSTDYTCATLKTIVEAIWRYGLHKGLVAWLTNGKVALALDADLAALFQVDESRTLTIQEIAEALNPHLYPPSPIKIEHFVKIAGPAHEHELVATLQLPHVEPSQSDEHYADEHIAELEQEILEIVHARNIYDYFAKETNAFIKTMMSNYIVMNLKPFTADACIKRSGALMKQSWLPHAAEIYLDNRDKNICDFIVNLFDLPSPPSGANTPAIVGASAIPNHITIHNTAQARDNGSYTGATTRSITNSLNNNATTNGIVYPGHNNGNANTPGNHGASARTSPRRRTSSLGTTTRGANTPTSNGTDGLSNGV